MLVGISDKVLYKWLDGKEYIDCSDEAEAIAIAAGHFIQTGEPATAFMSVDGFMNALNFITSWIIPDGIEMKIIISTGRMEKSHYVATEMLDGLLETLKAYEPERISYEVITKE